MTQHILNFLDDYYTRTRASTSINGEDVKVLHFNNGTQEYLPQVLQKQPAVEFENKTGYSGIAYHYTLPKGLTERHIEDYIVVLRHAQENDIITATEQTKQLSGLWKELKSLNKHTLGRLQFDEKSTDHLEQALLGAASAFNADDIHFYMKHNHGWFDMIKDPAYAQKEISVRQKFNFLFGWAPSPQTLDIIDVQFKNDMASRFARGKRDIYSPRYPSSRK